jgi:lipopolysaccharide transport system ATP-binding protein
MAYSEKTPDSAQQAVISINNLTKVYKLYDKNIDRLKESLHPLGKQYHRKFSALNRINLEVKRGEVLGIIGKNGAGKSTLLNIIAGVTIPSQGELVTQGKVTALLGIGTGFNPELTGIQNIYLNGTLQGYTKVQMDAKMEDILAFADIGSFANQPIKIYSSGMQARLGFAVAIHVDPDILIIDEVLAVGDELFRRKCYSKIESFMEEGKTILFVTHGVSTVNELCTRAVLIDRGELILEGPPKLVTIHYMKYLYAKPEDQARTREEIIQLNRDSTKKNAFIAEMEKGTIKEIAGPKILKDPALKSTKVPPQKSFYLSGFESKSKVIQKTADIDILDIHIATLDGKKVNCLANGEEFYLNYRVRFGTTTDKFAFSWAFKNEKGIKLSGTRYPGQKAVLEQAQAGELFHLKWRFRCTLLAGVYYIDIAIPRLVDGEKKFLVACFDILAFKVQKPEYDKRREFNWGIFKMDQRLESIETISNIL